MITIPDILKSLFGCKIEKAPLVYVQNFGLEKQPLVVALYTSLNMILSERDNMKRERD